MVELPSEMRRQMNEELKQLELKNAEWYAQNPNASWFRRALHAFVHWLDRGGTVNKYNFNDNGW